MTAIIGRDDELRAIEAFLAETPAAPAALVLEGEPGIGKSTLWRRGVELAEERGYRTLVARPAEAERAHARAALGDLLEKALDEVDTEVPPPRLRALRVALLLDEPDPDPPEPLAVEVATRSTLDALARAGPLVVCIDDEQWLDASSAAALTFALRRLTEPAWLLLSRRAGVGTRVEDAVSRDRVERLAIGPLSRGAIHQLLRDQLGRPLSRVALHRFYEVSGGNPFYALELARALGANDAIGDPTQPLPVPERLEELVHARLEGLAGEAHEALVLASADARLTPAQLETAGLPRSALEPALAERLIEIADGTVRFTHPLLASVLYQRLTAAERQRAHALLASVVDDPLGRARHLALATERPDEDIAAALERASAAANVMGTPIVAAELGEHALRLTPPEATSDIHRRVVAAARAHLAAGEVDRGRVLAGELVERAPSSAERAEAFVLMAELEYDEAQRNISFLREALKEHGAPLALQAWAHQQLALMARFTDGHVVAERHAQASVELAEQVEDAAMRAAALAGLALIRFNAGQPDALGLAEEAHRLAAAAAAPRSAIQAGFALAHILVWSSLLERARDALADLRRSWGGADERVMADSLWYLALAELRAGRLALADEYANRSRELSLQYARDEAETPQNLLPLALIAAHRGELEAARELAERNIRLADRQRALLPGAGVVGMVDLWSGSAEAAVARFEEAERVAAAIEFGEPCMFWWRDDYAEALLELGRVDDAVAVLDSWEADARRVGREWVLAHVARCRGLAAAARGNGKEAESLLSEAVTRHAAVGDPFARARAQLALGLLRRRARQKRPAREAIEQALASFEEIGAAGWADRARRELTRIGGRTRSEGLTPAERRVADLAASGRTNREVAAALFLAERTVESHLSRVYAKLGVRSRTELARRLD